MSQMELLLPTLWMDYSQISYLYWKSPLCIENRDNNHNQPVDCKVSAGWSPTIQNEKILFFFMWTNNLSSVSNLLIYTSQPFLIWRFFKSKYWLPAVTVWIMRPKLNPFSASHQSKVVTMYVFKCIVPQGWCNIYYIYALPWGLSTLAKEFTAAARIMQSSSNELSTLVSGKIWNVNKRTLLLNTL